MNWLSKGGIRHVFPRVIAGICLFALVIGFSSFLGSYYSGLTQWKPFVNLPQLDFIPRTAGGQFLFKWGAYGGNGSFGSGDGQLHFPYKIAVNGTGHVYVVDDFNHRVQVFTVDGQLVNKWGSFGTGDGEFNYPYGIAVNGTGHVYVTDAWNHRVQVFTATGQFVNKWGSSGTDDGQFNYPYGIAVNGTGNVYIADCSNNRTQVFTATGQFVNKWGSSGTDDGQFNSPIGIVVNGTGYVYVTDDSNNRVQIFTPAGQFVGKWGLSGDGDGQFNCPDGIAINTTGHVYVADTNNNRVQVFTAAGQFLGKWGSAGNGDGQFNSPSGIAVNATGQIYVADTSNHRIQAFAGLNPPFAPRNLVASPMDECINLTWDRPVNDGGSPVENYTIYRGTASGNMVYFATGGNVTSFSDSNVTAGQTYFYAVSAVNGIGEGPQSAGASATAPGIPGWAWGVIIAVLAAATVFILMLVKTRARGRVHRTSAVVLLSYQREEKSLFRVHEIEEQLGKLAGIRKIISTQADENSHLLPDCNVILLFCSPTGSRSSGEQGVLEAAYKKDLPVVPVFTHLEDVPALLRSMNGVAFNAVDIPGTVKAIHDIIRKITSSANPSGGREA